METELHLRRSKFREKLRKQKLQSIVKEKRAQIVEYQLQDMKQGLHLLEQLPNHDALIELAQLLSGSLLEHPLAQCCLLQHYDSVLKAYEDLTRETIEDEDDDQIKLATKSLMVVLAVALSGSPPPQVFLELISNKLLSRLSRLNIFDSVFLAVRTLHPALPESLVELLGSHVRDRTYWGTEELRFLTDVVEKGSEPKAACTRVKQVYFSEQVLSTILDNMTSGPYSEPNGLAGQLLNLLDSMTYYEEQWAVLLVRCNLLSSIKFYVLHSYPEERLSCLHILQNICSYEELREEVQKSGYIGLLMDRLPYERTQAQSSIMQFLANYSQFLSSQEEADHFIKLDGIRMLIDALNSEQIKTDETLLQSVVAGLRNIFRIGDSLSSGESREVNPYKLAFQAYDGINSLELLATHSSAEHLIGSLTVHDQS